jgi:hypothetical protein
MELGGFLNPEKSSVFESELNFAIISLSLYNIKELVGNSYSILLRSLISTIFITKNARFVVAIEIGRISTSPITRKKKIQIYF